MSSFGFLGSAYMFFLVALLIVALGAGTSFLFRSFADTVSGLKTNQQQTKQTKGGSIVMENNPWLRYALYSFLGILILVAVLGLVMPGQPEYSSNMMMNNGGMMSGMMPMQNARPMGRATGGMLMNGMAGVYPFSNGGMMSAMPVNMGYTGMPMDGIPSGGAMHMVTIPVISIPVNTVLVPMYGAGMPGMGFYSLPMRGM